MLYNDVALDSLKVRKRTNSALRNFEAAVTEKYA